MAFGFALLLLTIRYKGVEIATNFIPHAGTVLWLGKHAYQYSQPKVLCECLYKGPERAVKVEIQLPDRSMQVKLKREQADSVDLGFITENPELVWHTNGTEQRYTLTIAQHLKRVGRNLKLQLTLEGDTLVWQLQD